MVAKNGFLWFLCLQSRSDGFGSPEKIRERIGGWIGDSGLRPQVASRRHDVDHIMMGHMSVDIVATVSQIL